MNVFDNLNPPERGHLKPPDLQRWVAHYGGYQNIGWKVWDGANTAWQEERQQTYRSEA